MITPILILALLAFAGYFKGKMDAIADDGIKQLDWSKKYNFTKPGMANHWWYFGFYQPTFPERFPFSTTVLVFLTDKWHLCQFFMLRACYLAIALALWPSAYGLVLLPFIVFPIILGVFFEISYRSSRIKYNRKPDMQDAITNDFDDGPNDNPQTTSVPEKRITDI